MNKRYIGRYVALAISFSVSIPEAARAQAVVTYEGVTYQLGTIPVHTKNFQYFNEENMPGGAGSPDPSASFATSGSLMESDCLQSRVQELRASRSRYWDSATSSVLGGRATNGTTYDFAYVVPALKLLEILPTSI